MDHHIMRRLSAGMSAVVLAAGVVLVAEGTAFADSSAGASNLASTADDSQCVNRNQQKDQLFPAYVTSEGVGLVAWHTKMSIEAHDQCELGGFQAGITFSDENIKAKGGSIQIGSVRYKTSLDSDWRAACATAGLDEYAYQPCGRYLDFGSTARVTEVKVNTSLKFDGNYYAPRSLTCNLVSRSCSAGVD